MKNRTLIFILISIFFIGFEINHINADDNVKKKNITLGVSFINTNSVQRKKEFLYFSEIANQKNISLIAFDANNNKNQEIEQMEELIDKNVDCIICFTYDDNLARIIKKAKKHGIYVIRYDAYNGYVMTDIIVTINYSEIGKMQGEWLINRVPSGNIVVFSGSPADIVATQLHNSAMEVIKEKVKSGAYDIVLDTPIKNWDPSNVLNEMNKINNIENVNAILAPNDYIASAVIDELKKKGLNGKILVCGMDAVLENCRNIINGNQDMTILKDWGDRVKLAIDLMYNLVNNIKIDNDDFIKYEKNKIPVIYVKPILINKNNIKELINRNWYSKEELGLDM